MATATAPRTNEKETGSDFERLVGQNKQQMSADLLQMKMENETIMTECRLHPRNMEAIKSELADMLDAFPALAQDSIYTKPIGGGKTARGLSIRAAETLAEAYGYCRIRSDVTPLDLLSVKVEATFTDYQKGRVWQDGGILSKQYRQAQAKGGGTATYDDDRFYNVVCKSEVSKRIREVILRSVNSALKAWYESECERRLGETLTDAAVKKWIDGFADKGVSAKQVEGFIGRPQSMGWTKDDKVKLLGVWNAIEDGHTTIAEAFGTTPPGATPPKVGAKTLADVKPAIGASPQPTLADRFAACKTHKEALKLRDDICEPTSDATEEERDAAEELYAQACKDRDWK